jgi:hypothetical protein
MRRALWLVPAILLGLAAPAYSAPILVSAGDVVTFNFDFAASGVVPPPPYQFIQFEPGGYGSLVEEDFGLWRGFSELDGGGSLMYGPQSSQLIATLLTDDDGIFSMILTVLNGSFTVDPVAYGYENQVLLTPAVAPVSVVTTAAVPEPSTLMLAGIGLAGAVCHHRRRRRVL